MQMVFKAFILMMVALSSAQPVTANENVYSRDMPEDIFQALATGIVDAEIQQRCVIQATAENREYVANETECRTSLGELENALSKEGWPHQIKQVKRFRAHYGI
ncbi:hypothetical protein [Marinobacter shengliensis]|uniref:hypothetical protein n=1 Tax=Marinobacter shengliensis TaxID=1389223 RepID=UPI001108F528|nr:hypothetical protein [Marinobacter shengliensis]